MMKTAIQRAALALVLAGGAATWAQAGVLTYQDVSFSSTWNANVLTVEIDAAHPSGDWSSATGLAALGIKGIGNYTGVSVTAAPKAASDWTTSSTEMSANGCSGSSGQDGSRLCFSGSQIALSDDMVFTFAFTGSAIQAVDPHVKVEFVNTTGAGVGSLLSQDLLPGTATPVQFSPTMTASATTTSLSQAQQLSAGASSPASVAEPWTPALLLGGLALIGITRRRKDRKA